MTTQRTCIVCGAEANYVEAEPIGHHKAIDHKSEAEKWKWIAQRTARLAVGREKAATYLAQVAEQYEHRNT